MNLGEQNEGGEFGASDTSSGMPMPKSPPPDNVIDFDQYDEDTDMIAGLSIGASDAAPLAFTYSPTNKQQQRKLEEHSRREKLLDSQLQAQHVREQSEQQEEHDEEQSSSPSKSENLRLSDDICSVIPAMVLKTFEPDSQTLSTVDDETATAAQSNAFLKALVNSIARALNGGSVVTAPILYKGFPWLGSITVKSGSLRGNLVVKHRVYTVQARVLAGGHVLPWCIGREWRYSELRKLLVDDLQVLLKKHDLQKEFAKLAETFPPKTWQNRNSDETAEYRSSSIQNYVRRLMALASMTIETKDFERSSKKKRRTGNRSSGISESRERSGSSANNDGASATGAVGTSSAIDNSLAASPYPPPRKNSFEDLVGEGIGEIVELVVQKLLNINSELRYEVAQVSHELGTLITMTPTDHCHVTKEFKLTPQQAL